MGSWGIKLFEDDHASDVKDEYTDRLKRGELNEDVTADMKGKYLDDDEETNAIFWYALADCQWNIGRLLSEVKEKALYYLDLGTDYETWEDPKHLAKRVEVLEQLKIKLNSPQPPEKKIKKYIPARCEWKDGDVYAYHMTGKDSEGTEFFGKYVIMIKDGESESFPLQITPYVYILKHIFDVPPNISEVYNYEYINQNLKWERYQHYKLSFFTWTKGKVPYDKLTYLGNLGENLRKQPVFDCKEDYKRIVIGFKEEDFVPSEMSMTDHWENFEKVVARQFGIWKNSN